VPLGYSRLFWKLSGRTPEKIRPERSRPGQIDFIFRRILASDANSEGIKSQEAFERLPGRQPDNRIVTCALGGFWSRSWRGFRSGRLLVMLVMFCGLWARARRRSWIRGEDAGLSNDAEDSS
jgi:hypothetical protein